MVAMPVPQLSTPVVHREPSCLDISKGAGADAIHSEVVRWFAEIVAVPLSTLIDESQTMAVAPTDWRFAKSKSFPNTARESLHYM